MKWKIIKVLILLALGMTLGLSTSGCSPDKSESTLIKPPSQNILPNISDNLKESDRTASKEGTAIPVNKSTSPETTIPKNNSTSPEILEKRSETIPVLYYHSVMVEPGNELRIPPVQFEEQMRYLAEKGYNVVSLDQLNKYFYEKGTLPEKPVVITFDDGYEDNYTNAYPILTKYGLTAAVFVVTNYIQGKGFMSWEQLEELGNKGWQIEGHTMNHPYLVKDKLNAASLKSELIEAKDILEKRFGRPVKFFAYPFGDNNADIVRTVKEAGYLMAFTTERGWADRKNPMQVHRVYCFANMGIEEFARRLQNPQY